MVRMPHWPIPADSRIIKFDLERIGNLLHALGNPHEKLPPIVHVAGTNGKGSTIAFLKTILEISGYKVHRYTSPHLIKFNERIYLSGYEISDNFLYEIAEEVRLIAESKNIKVTFFEGTSVIAFLAFSRISADIVILETGMGGRLDATNIIRNPELVIFTPISIDHVEYLGPSIPIITREKAGILKKGCKAIVSQQYDEAFSIIEQEAEKLGVEIFAYEYDWGIKFERDGYSFLSQNKNITLPFPSLHGEHQIVNSATAIAAAIKLNKFNISDRHIINALQTTYWIGRIERLKNGYLVNKLPDGFEIWVDGAHNNAGAHCLSNWLSTNHDKPYYMIAGITKKRDAVSFFKHFSNLVECIVGVYVENEPSSYSAKQIQNFAIESGLKSYYASSIEEAIQQIILLSDRPSKIIVTGSLYLVGEFLYKNSL